MTKSFEIENPQPVFARQDTFLIENSRAPPLSSEQSASIITEWFFKTPRHDSARPNRYLTQKNI